MLIALSRNEDLAIVFNQLIKRNQEGMNATIIRQLIQLLYMNAILNGVQML